MLIPSVREPLALRLLQQALGVEEGAAASGETSGAPGRAKMRTVAGVFKNQLLDSELEGSASKQGRKGLIPTLQET
eukprot:929740-Rhodomonas_salina.2